MKLRLLPLLIAVAAGCSAQTPAAGPSGPASLRVLDTQVTVDREGTLVARQEGAWKPLTGAGYPTRVMGDGLGPRPRPLTSFAAVSDTAWFLTTPFEAFFSADRGQNWAKVLDRDQLRNGANLTAFAASPLNPQLLAAGTTFHGLWLSTDGGTKWKEQDEISAAYFYGDGSKEPIHALAWSAVDPARLYLAVGKDGGQLWSLDTATGKKQSFLFPGGGPLKVPEALAVHLEGPAEILEVRMTDAWWRWNLATGEWTKTDERTDKPVWDEAKAARMEKSKDRKALYLSAYTVSLKGELDKHLDFMAQRGLDTVVLDFKNDQGEIAYDSQVPLARAAKAVVKLFDAPSVIKKVHDRGFYLIARQVVFKDKKVYSYNNHQYAVWDGPSNKPWAFYDSQQNADGTTTTVQKEFWLDTYSSDVWDYNVAIAQELQTLGVDEIQFDYIRFPSDGPVNRIVNRFKVEGMTRLDALESYLQRARAGISLPISVDIYGYNGYFITDHLGQNMAMMSKYVDAISAMLYPSHFWKTFLPRMDYVDRAKTIYQDGSDRTFLNTGGRVHVRPWIQAFLIGGELKMADDRIAAYLNAQLSGTQNSRASGWLLWNSSNKYYMVTKPVGSYGTKVQLPY